MSGPTPPGQPPHPECIAVSDTPYYGQDAVEATCLKCGCLSVVVGRTDAARRQAVHNVASIFGCVVAAEPYAVGEAPK